MFGDKFNLGSIIKNAKKMQEMVQKAQEELAKLEVTGEAGAGAVKVTMSGEFFIRNIQLDPEILKEEPSVIEELIAAAVNEAVQKIKDYSQKSMMGTSKLFEGLQDEEK